MMNKNDQQELINKLDNVPLGRIDLASFRAVMRLQLWFTGRTHEIMLDFRDKAQSAILRKGGKDIVLQATDGFAMQSDILRMWGDTWSEWQAEFQQARREAARIAFGVQVVGHGRLIEPVVSGQKAVISESQITDGIYDPQLRILLMVAEEYLYGDGLNLSGRIWRIDREAREGINNVILRGIVNGSSALDMAKELEKFLGAGEDCPRWTSTRLYGRTSGDKAAGDPTGLLHGADCNGSGVSYKALRLARTEIQKIHSLATDRMMKQAPWVEAEKINLSAAHPKPDECDDAANGGEEGDGVYPVGTINLPLHPECFCFKTSVQMPADEFTKKLKGWLNGTQEWSEMDQYANDLGMPLDTDLTPAAVNLAVWLFGEDLDKWMK